MGELMQAEMTKLRKRPNVHSEWAVIRTRPNRGGHASTFGETRTTEGAGSLMAIARERDRDGKIDHGEENRGGSARQSRPRRDDDKALASTCLTGPEDKALAHTSLTSEIVHGNSSKQFAKG